MSSARGARLQDVAVVGVGQTQMARRVPRSTMSVVLESVRLALEDASLSTTDVDGMAARWPGPGGTTFLPGSSDWSKVLGVPLRWIGDTYPQGVPALLDAAAAIATGQCETVVVAGGQASILGQQAVAAYTRPDNEFLSVWGSITQAQFALVAQVYLHRHRPDRIGLASLAATIRNMGAVNPEAVMHGRGPYTAQDVLDSRVIASPLRLLEICLASEGAAAVVLSTVERARDLPHVPVRLLGGGCEWHRQQYVDPPRYDEVWSIGSDAAARTFGAAGLTVDDVDVCELYDINVFELVRQLEAIGFCREGEGVDFALARGIGPGGGLPTNTNGGLLSHAHIGWGAPTLKVIESVRQLRGTAPSGQVADAEVALVSGAGAGAQYWNLLALGRGA